MKRGNSGRVQADVAIFGLADQRERFAEWLACPGETALLHNQFAPGGGGAPAGGGRRDVGFHPGFLSHDDQVRPRILALSYHRPSSASKLKRRNKTSGRPRDRPFCSSNGIPRLQPENSRQD
jgi:hypothetical protein